MKAQVFKGKNPIGITAFLATLELACDSKKLIKVLQFDSYQITYNRLSQTRLIVACAAKIGLHHWPPPCKTNYTGLEIYWVHTQKQ